MLSALFDCFSVAGGFVAFGFAVWILSNLPEVVRALFGK